MTKKVFDAYSHYYDLLYRDKNYKAETDYICKNINELNPEAKSLLDLGCGTGRHDTEFHKRGFKTTGVELSEKMFRIAEKNKEHLSDKGKNLIFINGDIRSLKLRKKYDVIVSLFHVMNYQTKNADLDMTIKTVKKHLNTNGVFMFDFWYGPAVLQDKPLKRLKIIKDDKIMIKRKSTPFLKINENIVDVSFEILVTEKRTKKKSVINEIHSMRYLFIPEIEMILDNNGMKLIHTEEWMSGKKLTDKSWSAFAIAKLK